MSESVTANVGTFGKVTGFTKGNVAEFRGIPFATIPARFRRAELLTSLPGGSFEATKYGASPPQPPFDRKGEEYLFGEYVTTFFQEDSTRYISEEDCLNLNIVAPTEAVGKKKLPVMVWIYGLPNCLKLTPRRCVLGWRQFESLLQWVQPSRTQFKVE
jgi:carboxylesterase type B